jgi:DsbC/DsbD-like thiol-disulfide interchange protein
MAGIAALWMIAAPLAIATDSQPHGTVELVAEESSLQAARILHAGLHFKLEKGWHIYWTNPGDSGEPPRVKWALPPGFNAGPLQWPVPQRIEDHSLVDYGYPDEVLLPVEIQPPSSFGVATKVQLSAEVHWLVCREICVPGHAAINLTLPIGRSAAGTPSNVGHLFAQARAELPRGAPSSWKVTATLDQHHWTLNLETGSREANAAFFPLHANQIENAAAQKATSTSQGIRIEIQKSDQMLKPPARFSGVVVLASKQGYLIDAAVTVSK